MDATVSTSLMALQINADQNRLANYQPSLAASINPNVVSTKTPRKIQHKQRSTLISRVNVFDHLIENQQQKKNQSKSKSKSKSTKSNGKSKSKSKSKSESESEKQKQKQKKNAIVKPKFDFEPNGEIVCK